MKMTPYCGMNLDVIEIISALMTVIEVMAERIDLERLSADEFEAHDSMITVVEEVEKYFDTKQPVYLIINNKKYGLYTLLEYCSIFSRKYRTYIDFDFDTETEECNHDCNRDSQQRECKDCHE